MNRIEDYMFEYKQVEDLKKYYKDKELTIIGLNDSQGVNTTTLFRKGCLEYLADALKSDNVDSTVINAFSLMFNKTEHINYLLESNLSLEEIKDLQVNGMVSALEKAMQDFHMPKFLGKVGYISRILYRPKKGDDKILLTDSLKEGREPIVVYSCGANDLMREGWNNPFSIGKDYKNRDKNFNYDYAYYKLQDPKAVKRVIGRVEGNINNILTLNSSADIFTLGLYIPKSMQCDGMEVFNDAIARYNEYLMELCNKYKLSYIDTEKTGKEYNKSNVNFHVSTAGHNALAHEIIDKLHYKKCSRFKTTNDKVDGDFKVYNHKSWDLLINLKHDLKRVEEESIGSFGRQKEVYEEMKKELERQIGVVEKVAEKIDVKTVIKRR